MDGALGDRAKPVGTDSMRKMKNRVGGGRPRKHCTRNSPDKGQKSERGARHKKKIKSSM